MIRAALRSVNPLCRLIALWWWKWAAAEIDPMHRDAAYVHRKVYDLEREMS